LTFCIYLLKCKLSGLAKVLQLSFGIGGSHDCIKQFFQGHNYLVWSCAHSISQSVWFGS